MNKGTAHSAMPPTHSRSWRTIRVFISSTFRDMHAERDHLLRTVFPELKELCRTHRVHLIDVDLRWGVSEADAERGKAIDICLDEIDTCRPYFLGLLGHRYGYVPPGHQHSITAEEIYHGVLHNDVPKQILDLGKIIAGKLEDKPLSHQELNCLSQSYLWDADRRKYLLRDDIAPQEMDTLRSVFLRYSIYQKDRSYFFFRSESFTRLLAGDHPEDFFETGAFQKLQELKAEIRNAKLPVHEYDNLETFGQLVRDVLWAKIEAEAKEAVIEKDWLEREAEFHELFIADRTRRFVGRRELLDRMRAFCEMGDQPSVLAITGEPGCGKSALMARFAEETTRRRPDWLIISHFVGASPASTNLRRMLRRFCTQLSRALGSAEEVPEDIEELLTLFTELLSNVPENRPVLVIIDALNQLEKGDHAHSLSWLPQTLPAHVRFIISTLGGEALDALPARATMSQVEQVRGLSRPEVRELVKAYLAEIRHEFPNPQVEGEFFAKVEGGNPLYILVALEELRVFGKFEELEKRIYMLPDNVPDLFDQVLERIEGDFDPALVRDCVAFMACGRHGMTAEELQTLLRQHAPEADRKVEPVKLPDLVWRRLHRSFSAYLLNRSGVIDFFHGQLKEAVGKRYLSEDARRAAAHQTLADYFESRWSQPYLRALDELPHQRTRALDWTGLDRILCDLRFIEAKASAGMTYDLVSDYNAALSSNGVPTRTDIRGFARFVTAQSHVIAANPALTFQQAINEPDTTPQAQAAARILEAGQESRPFFGWINKPQSVSACLMTLTGHTKGVLACAFSPDGSRIVSASCDKTLKLWDVATGRVLATLTGHDDLVDHCAFSSDGFRIVSASWDGTLKLWDVATGRELVTLTDHDYHITACAFSPNGSRIVSASSSALDRSSKFMTIKLWDAATGRELSSLICQSDNTQASAFSPDCSRHVSISADKTLKVWDTATGKDLVTLIGHFDETYTCAFSPDGTRLVSASADKTLKVWDTATGRDLVTLTGHTGAVRFCSFSPDGSRIASASEDKTLKLWDVYTGNELVTLTGHSDHVCACAFSPDGAYVVSASDPELKLWDAATETRLADPAGHGDWVRACAFSPDGSRVLSASMDGTLILWDAATGRDLATLVGHNDFVIACAFSPDGSRILSASNTLKLWDAATGKELATLIRGDSWVSPFAFSPDGSCLVCASDDNSLKTWDGATGKELATLAGHNARVTALAFSPDGSLLVTASEDRTLRTWDAAEGTEFLTLVGHDERVDACAFSPDGSRILSSAGSKLKLWHSITGERLATLSGHDDWISACVFSPDGSRVVSASYDKTLKLWDASTGEDLFTLTGHGHHVTACAFSPDGSRIVSGSDDRTLKLWDVAAGKEIWEFRLNREVTCLCVSSFDCVVLGMWSGSVLMLQLANAPVGPSVITAWRKSIQESIFMHKPEDNLAVGCPYCRNWSTVEESDLGRTISCANCGKSLKLNPFTIDADWHPIARAWEGK
ncbi:MAG: DUF4062 domain-containing protein [Acidobacteria bacterium]|nr:DUF4062 domain-containing protein [Acidobacteriota bacterium]